MSLNKTGKQKSFLIFDFIIDAVVTKLCTILLKWFTYGEFSLIFFEHSTEKIMFTSSTTYFVANFSLSTLSSSREANFSFILTIDVRYRSF